MSCFNVFRIVLIALAMTSLVACGNGDDHQSDSSSHDHETHEHDGDTRWTCPMHPEVDEDEPGTCPICGMDLVEREDEPDESESAEEASGEREVLYWVAPMDSSYRRDEPGKSPMGMDLVPVYADEVPEEGRVRVGQGIQQAMNIRTTPAERGRLTRQIETVGRVEYDESRLHHVHLRVEGWIQELDVEAEGDHVAEGERLFTLYSPELVNAQEELLHALRRGEERVIRAARDRLQALNVHPDVIRRIERERSVMQFVPWHAPRDAYVTRLGVRHGMYVTPGNEVMELADLSKVWVIADVFESQADWVATGQSARIGLPYAPGEQARSEISHIYPTLNETTRSLRVRLPVDNPDGRLHPGMWNTVTIQGEPSEEAVIIPREAVIWTGRGNRVVTRDGDEHFQVKEVTTGMVSGERVAILDGIEAGDEVVVSGQFLIDSEAGLQGGHERLEDHKH